MAGETKRLTYAEGVEVTAPSQSFLVASSVSTYASDAAYVAAKGSGAAAGDLYGNTADGTIHYYDGSAWKSNHNMKNNFTAVVAPVVGDDDADGYQVGSLWLDTVTEIWYYCADASTGAAVWTELINTDSTQTMTNKTLTSPSIDTADIDGGTASNTARITIPKNTKSNLDGLDRKEATIVYGTDTALPYIDNGSDLIPIGSGTGSGGVNFVDNGDFEVNIDDWATSDGSNVPISRITSGQLSGDASLRLSKAASDESDDYIYGTITTEPGYAYRMLTLSFIYATSANYDDDDIRVRLYDVTNSAYIDCADGDLKANSYGVFTGQFQLTDSTSYQVRLYIVSTNATAYTVDIDDVDFRPKPIVYGAPVTDWESYTPTGSWTTNTTYTGYKRRVGDTAYYDIKVTLSGAPDSTTLTINVADGTIDTSKVNADGDKNLTGSTVSVLEGGVAVSAGAVRYVSTTAVQPRTFFANGSYQETTIITQAAPFTFGSSDEIHIGFSVPIVGWKSNTQLSETSSNRMITFRAHLSGDQTVTTQAGTGEKIDLDSVDFDIAGGWDAANHKYIIPETGYYQINGHVWSSSITTLFYSVIVIDNPATDAYYGNTASERSEVSRCIYCTQGQSVYLYVWQNESTSETIKGGSGTYYTSLDIHKVSNPQTLAATESVYAIYTTNAGQSFTDETATVVDFEDKVVDPHNAVTTGASWVFTAPYSKLYHVSAQTAWDSTTNLTDGFIAIYYNTSTQIARGNLESYATLRISRDIYLNKGDTVNIKLYQDDSTGAARALVTGSAYNFISISG